jgi:hypothetical protein
MKSMQDGNRDPGADAQRRRQKPRNFDQARWTEYKNKVTWAFSAAPSFDEMKKSPAAAEFLSHLKSEPIFTTIKISSKPTHILASFWNQKGEPVPLELDTKKPWLQASEHKRYEKLVHQEKIWIVERQTRRVLGIIEWIRGQGDEPFFYRTGDAHESVDSILESVEARARKAMAETPYTLKLSKSTMGGEFRMKEERQELLGKVIDGFRSIGLDLTFWDIKTRFDTLKRKDLLPEEAREFMKQFDNSEHAEMRLHFEFGGRVEWGLLRETTLFMVTGSGQSVGAVRWMDGTDTPVFENLLLEGARQKADAKPAAAGAHASKDCYKVHVSKDRLSGNFLVSDNPELLRRVGIEFNELIRANISLNITHRLNDLKAQPEVRDFMRKSRAEPGQARPHFELCGNVEVGVLTEAGIFIIAASGNPLAVMRWKLDVSKTFFETF